MFKTLKTVFKIDTQNIDKDLTIHEDLTKSITLGDIQKDGYLNSEWTTKRINDIIQQLKTLENTITLTIDEPIHYSNFTGYWARLTFDMTSKTTCKIHIGISIFTEHWLDKNNLIEPDTRPEIETIGRYHTRDTIFKEKQNICSILELIRQASTEIGMEELQKQRDHIEWTNKLRGI